MSTPRLKAYIYLLIVCIIWGVAGPVIKLTLKEVPPFIFLLYRFGISSVIAIAWFLFTKKAIFTKKLSTNLKMLSYCFLNTTASLGLLFWGLSKTSLLESSLIVIFGPILTVLAGYWFLKDRITKIEKIGIEITFLGSLLILIEPLIKANINSGDFFGNLLVFGYVVFTTISAVLMKEILREGVNPVSVTHLSFIVGFLTVIPIVLFLYPPFSIYHLIFSIPPAYHAGVWYMAILSGTIAFSLQNIAQKTIEVSEAAIFMYLFPIISGILAIFILGDKLTPIIVIGSTLTIVGIVIAERKKKRYN
ncbi:MAG TPA: DMT family transporter [Alphaproteobacteria bacterium]|jgi:drug/metabolite transporter (DMT)-like permease|nr:DMT family transporter [Alphaproteobacteria bacterium]